MYLDDLVLQLCGYKVLKKRGKILQDMLLLLKWMKANGTWQPSALVSLGMKHCLLSDSLDHFVNLLAI